MQQAVESRRTDTRRWQVDSAQRALRRLLRTVRQVVGAPDYERYLEHQAARHPGCAPLTPREAGPAKAKSAGGA